MMTPQTDSPATDVAVFAEAVTTFFDGKFSNFFVVDVDSASREMSTMEFFEKRPDLGEVQLLKKVGWEITVPQDARPFVASSGLLRDHLNTFWVGWRVQDTLSALSVYQDRPTNIRLDPQTRLIQPAIAVPSEKMLQYIWLPEGAGWSLCKYEFRGSQDEPGDVEKERLTKAEHEPLLFAALPVPGAEDDRTVIAWIEQTPKGVRTSAILCVDDSLETLATPAIPYVSPLSRQRLAMQVDKDGVISVGFVELSPIGGYVAMEVQFDFAKHESRFNPAGLSIPRATLSSACMFYSKDQHERRSFVCALSEEGVLSVTTPGRNFVRILRTGVNQGYDYPIVTSSTGRYEAIRSGGQVALTMLP